MPPLFNVLYIGFLDSRIKSLEAERSKDEFYLAKCAIEAEIDAVNAKIRENEVQFDGDDDRKLWNIGRNRRLLAEKAVIESRKTPLPEKSQKRLLKIRMYKLKKHVFGMYVERRAAIHILNRLPRD
jgi:hypothetical protein